jgi:hypothetical protein
MENVYGNADRVVVHLASTSEDSGLVDFLCRTLYFYLLGGGALTEINATEKYSAVVDRWFAPNKHDITAAHSLLNNDYFSRV